MTQNTDYPVTVKCPNCQERVAIGEPECWTCGFTGSCLICDEDTEGTDTIDLRYCSPECARKADHEARFVL